VNDNVDDDDDSNNSKVNCKSFLILWDPVHRKHCMCHKWLSKQKHSL